MNVKLIIAVATLSIGLGVSNVSNADTRHGQARYYDSLGFGLSLYFGSRSRSLDRSRYGYSDGGRNDKRYYDNRNHRNRYYGNRSYRSNNYCPDYGIIYYTQPNRGCFGHGAHFHCG